MSTHDIGFYEKISKMKKDNKQCLLDTTYVTYGQNQNQNSLLVKRQNDNTSPGDWPRKISP